MPKTKIIPGKRGGPTCTKNSFQERGLHVPHLDEWDNVAVCQVPRMALLGLFFKRAEALDQELITRDGDYALVKRCDTQLISTSKLRTTSLLPLVVASSCAEQAMG